MLGALRKLVQCNLKRPYHPLSLSSSRFLTIIQKHLARPALFNGAHRTPVLGGLGYLPSRLMTIFLVLFVAVTIVANATPYKLALSSHWETNARRELMGLVLSRIGVISLALVPVTVLLSARYVFPFFDIA